MPQDSAIYGVARIRSAERGLIGRERMRRFAETEAAEVLRQLVEAGYGAMPDARLEDTESMISAELARAAELVREATCDEKQTNIFLMLSDVNNLKFLIKLRLLGSHEEPMLMRGGCFDAKLLAKLVEDGEYDPLPEEFRTALEALELSFIGREPDPARVSTVLDSAYIDYALANGNAFTKEYFRAFADFTNVAALFRVRALGGERERLAQLLVSPGEISKETILAAFDTAEENLARALGGGPSADDIKRGIEDAIKTGSAAAIERARDDHLIRLASIGKNDTDTLRPIVGFLLAKRQEARDLRLILTAKRNGLTEEVINERMRLLYGE